MVNLRAFKWIICLLLILGPAENLLAGGMGTSNAEFLRIPAGARPAAMGGAFSALANDANASFWNPAGLSKVQGSQLSLMHLAWFQSLNYEYLAYAMGMGNGNGIGGNMIYFWTPDFNSSQDDEGFTHDPQAGRMNDMALSLSYGHNFDYIEALRGVTRVGATCKLISRTLMDQSQYAACADLGIMTEAANGFTIAVSALNMGSSIKEDMSPLTFKLGAALELPLSGQEHQLNLAVDLSKPIDLANKNDKRFEAGMGLEYIALKTVSIRLGSQTGQDLASITAGVGFKYDILQVDYAFAPYGLLGYTHRFAISFDFPNAGRPVAAKPQEVLTNN
jgi:hypothetical protein